MNRRDVLRRGGIALSVPGALALSGCSSGGDGGGGDDQSTDGGQDTGDGVSTETDTPMTTEPSSSDGSSSDDDGNGLSAVVGQAVDISGTVESDIDELEIIDHRATLGEGQYVGEGALGLAILVENTGEKTADIVFGYSWELAVYDSSGNEMFSGTAGGISGPPDSALDPGTSGPVVLGIGAYEPDQIGRYEVTLTCQSTGGGAYCE